MTETSKDVTFRGSPGHTYIVTVFDDGHRAWEINYAVDLLNAECEREQAAIEDAE